MSLAAISRQAELGCWHAHAATAAIDWSESSHEESSCKEPPDDFRSLDSREPATLSALPPLRVRARTQPSPRRQVVELELVARDLAEGVDHGGWGGDAALLPAVVEGEGERVLLDQGGQLDLGVAVGLAAAGRGIGVEGRVVLAVRPCESGYTCLHSPLKSRLRLAPADASGYKTLLLGVKSPITIRPIPQRAREHARNRASRCPAAADDAAEATTRAIPTPPASPPPAAPSAAALEHMHRPESTKIRQQAVSERAGKGGLGMSSRLWRRQITLPCAVGGADDSPRGTCAMGRT